MTMHRTSRGFTLIELMIVVAIIGIIAAVAYPGYVQHVLKTRRGAATACLSELAQHMERQYTTSMTYMPGGVATLPTLPCIAESGASYGFSFNVAGTTATSFTLEAAPTGAQAADIKCATLSLNSIGDKGISATGAGTGPVATCWR